MMSNCHTVFFFQKFSSFVYFWNLNCNMNGLRHKFSLWMCFTIILPQSIGCQCYFKCSQKQLEQKFFWFHYRKKQVWHILSNFAKVAGFTPFNYIWIELNCFYGMVDRRKAFSLISSRDHCQRSSPSWISVTPRAGFEPAQNLSSRLVEWSFVQ